MTAIFIDVRRKIEKVLTIYKDLSIVNLEAQTVIIFTTGDLTQTVFVIKHLDSII